MGYLLHRITEMLLYKRLKVLFKECLLVVLGGLQPTKSNKRTFRLIPPLDITNKHFFLGVFLTY